MRGGFGRWRGFGRKFANAPWRRRRSRLGDTPGMAMAMAIEMEMEGMEMEIREKRDGVG